MTYKPLLLLMASLLLQTPDAVASNRIADKLLAQFEMLLVGEFDNYNQVNFQNNDFLDKADIPNKKHARLYKRIARIDAPELGQHVFYQQIHGGGKEQPVYRQSIQVLFIDETNNRINAENYTFLNPKNFINLWDVKGQLNLSKHDLKPVGEQCHSEYQLMGESFVGGINKAKCRVASEKFGFLNLSTQQVFSNESFWHLEEGFLPSGKELFGRSDDIPHKLRRAKNFTCWAAFKTDKVKPDGEYQWDFFSDITLHNQGDIAEFSTTEKIPKHYFIRLKETIFPAGQRPDVFELFVHENSEKVQKYETKALAYTWTNTGSNRLGLNLRWMQASCRLAI